MRSRPVIGGRAFQFEPHHCFACGELNEHGLHLVLHADASGCRTDLTLNPGFQGWEGIVHGGILGTILDEVMAWAVIGRGTWGVTARMTVEFRRPVPVGLPIRAEGFVTEATRRLFRTTGQILDPASGSIFATAEGTYTAVPADRLVALQKRYGLRLAADRAESPEPVDA
ncbi:MAG: uncharacterized protein HW391_874 [Chloroflexi bacterium]|nr:uncharacterized protein [Chloroflexota bacterium]